VIKKAAEKILIDKDLRTEIELMWENKSDTIKNRGNFNNIKFIQKISENHICKARCQRTRENSPTGYSVHNP